MFFISPENLFSFSRYLKLRPEFLVIYKKGLSRKISLISKFMTSKPGKQIITIHKLTNISRSKRKQAMEFGQIY